jgi:hypothetical protein
MRNQLKLKERIRNAKAVVDCSKPKYYYTGYSPSVSGKKL